MAIIKTLLLQAFMLLSFLGTVQCQAAGQPTFVATTDSGGTEVTDVADCNKWVQLKCTRKAAATLFMRFTKGEADFEGWTAPTGEDLTHDLKNGDDELDATHYGVYKCKAAKTAEGGSPSELSATQVNIKCKACVVATGNATCTGNKAIGPNSYCKETDGCTCEYGGDLGACNACVDGTNAGCPDVKPYCNADTHTCQVCSVTDHFGCSGNTPRCDSGTSCKKCAPTNNVGCTDPKLPYCPVAGPCKPCDQDDGKPCDPATETCETTGECKAKITTQASPATGSSGGGTNSKGTTTKASVTSSAGTVTSTACLVIASVVVALMI